MLNDPKHKETVSTEFESSRGLLLVDDVCPKTGISGVPESSSPTEISNGIAVIQVTIDSEEISDGKFSGVSSKTLGVRSGENKLEDVFPKNLPKPYQENKYSILIVEDNKDMLDYISSLLQNENYIVLTAQNGEEAIQIILNHVPSLVLSDLMMPKMNGIEMTRYIKRDVRTSHIPVILLTAKSEIESKLEGLRAGADDYITKPFLPEELIVRIRNLIDQRRKLQEKFRGGIMIDPTPTNEMSLDDKFLTRARDVVESNMKDSTFTVEKMAEEMTLSRTQLLRKLKALTGLSPNDFIKSIRLKRAADMISKKTNTITQIGFAVGFNDQSYFTKCFKKQFGITPTEFYLNPGQQTGLKIPLAYPQVTAQSNPTAP